MLHKFAISVELTNLLYLDFKNFIRRGFFQCQMLNEVCAFKYLLSATLVV